MRILHNPNYCNKSSLDYSNEDLFFSFRVMLKKILIGILIFCILLWNVSAGWWATLESSKKQLVLDYGVSLSTVKKIDTALENMSSEALDILTERLGVAIHKYRHHSISPILYYIQLKVFDIKNVITVQVGDYIYIHYIGYLENGTEFDNSYKKWEYLETFAWRWYLIPGFDEALIGMRRGDKKTIVLPPSEAYGEKNEENNHELAWETLIFDIEIITIGN